MSSISLTGLRLRVVTGLVVAGLVSLVPHVLLADAAEDERLRQRVNGRLAGQVSLHPEGLDLQVRDGVVHITGNVGSLGEKRTLERLVGSMIGVQAVSSDLTVRQSSRSQADIIQEIHLMLERRPRFRNNPIGVTASGGEVTLSGSVLRAVDRLDAGAIASDVEGVIDVRNEIVVQALEGVPPGAVRDRVASILTNPLIFGVIRDLRVEVSGSTVTLWGVATRPTDRLEAARLALTVPGVTGVENRIRMLGS